MAVRIMCSVCDKFIREARVAEMRNLTGTEICQPCEKRIEFVMNDIKIISQNSQKDLLEQAATVKKNLDVVEKIAKQAINSIEATKQRVTSELEAAKKKVLTPKDTE